MVKNLKGGEQKLQLQYLTLRHGGRVAEYLKTYPEYKGDFAVFRSQLHGFTRSLHQNYLDCFDPGLDNGHFSDFGYTSH